MFEAQHNPSCDNNGCHKPQPQDFYPLIMASERRQQQVYRLLGDAAEAVAQGDWE